MAYVFGILCFGVLMSFGGKEPDKVSGQGDGFDVKSG
jgi:hypothetical protein